MRRQDGAGGVELPRRDEDKKLEAEMVMGGQRRKRTRDRSSQLRAHLNV
jgi:hypothetical protein